MLCLEPSLFFWIWTQREALISDDDVMMGGDDVVGQGAARVVWFWCQAAPMSLKPEDGQHSDYTSCNHAAHFTVSRYHLATDAAGTAPVNTVGTHDAGYTVTLPTRHRPQHQQSGCKNIAAFS